MRKVIKIFMVLAMMLVTLDYSENLINAQEVVYEESNLKLKEDHLLLDVSFEDNVNDASQYQTHGQSVGDITYTEGVKGKAIRINNADKGSFDKVKAIQYVDFGLADQLQFGEENHSFSFWLDSKAGAGNGAALLSNKDFSSGANKGYTVGLFDTGMRYNFKTDAAGRTDINTYGSKEVMETGWHHYVMSVDRLNDVIIYRDGVRVDSKKISQHNTSVDTGFPFVLGASGIYHNGIIDAKVDELKVYNTNISAQDATDLYVDGAVYLAAASASETLNTHESKEGMSPQLIAQLKTYIEKLEALKTDISAMDTQAILNLLNEVETLEAEIKSFNPNEEDPLVLHLEFNGDTLDSSSYANHAEVVNKGGGSISFEEGINGQAIHIQSPNGSVESNAGGEATEYLKLPKTDSLDFKDESFSIALWMKQPFQITGNANAIVSNKNYYSGSNQGYALGMFKNGLTVNAKASGGARKDTKRYSQVFDQDWHFVVSEIDREKNQMRLYYDNQLMETVNISDFSGSIHPDSYAWVIGASATYSNGLTDTLLDEVRFYKGTIPEALRNEWFEAYDVQAEFLKYYQDVKNDVEATISLGNTSQARIDEIRLGFDYIDQEIQKDFDRTRLVRDLKNMLDRFEDSNEPNFTFNVVTDTHIDLGDGEPENYDNYLQDVRWLNPKSQVMMNSGDFTTNAKLSEYQNHYEILEKNQLPNRPFLTALGNHDVRWLCNPRNPESNTNREVGTCPDDHPNANLWKDRYLQFNAPYMGDDWNGEDVFHKQWINGYLFIVINTELDLKDWAYISDRQIEWLDEAMKESDPNKPVFIAMHQVLSGTAEYIEGDLIGGQDEAIKEVLSKYGNAVMFTGHIHSSADRAKVHSGEWGHLMDMASYSYVYTSGGDRRNQISYQVEVYDEEIIIRVRDHVSGVWIEEYEQRFSLNDPLPTNPRDNAFDVEANTLDITAGSEDVLFPVKNLLDNDYDTLWKSNKDETDRSNLWINMSMEELTQVTGLRYLPLPKNAEGTIRNFEVWISQDHGSTYTLHEGGSFTTTNSWELFMFKEAVEATDVKINIMSNVGSKILATGAEFRLLATSKEAQLKLIEEYKNTFDLLNKDYYEVIGYEAFEAALEAAKNLNTPSNIQEALDRIKDAKAQLVLKEIVGLEDKYEMTVGETLTLNVNLNGSFEFDSTRLEVSQSDRTITIKALETGSFTIVYRADNGKDKTIAMTLKMDSRELDSLVEELEQLEEALYTKASFKVLKELLEGVSDFIENGKQSQLVQYLEDLKFAKDNLVLLTDVKVDRTALEEVIAEVKLLDLSDYTQDSVDALQVILTDAEMMLLKADEELTQEVLDEMCDELKTALDALVAVPLEETLKTDRLEDLVVEYKKVDVSKYTVESSTHFTTTLNKAEALLNSLSITRVQASQKDIDDMADELVLAYNNLKEKEDTKEDVSVPTGIHNSRAMYSLLMFVGLLLFLLGRKRQVN